MESPEPIRRTPPKNLGLLELIRAKREWDWKPSVAELKQGFRGWHQRGYLPHFDAPGVTQFVTFQLDDSFPVTRRAEFEAILKEPDDSAKRRKLEAWLDRGHGGCWLRRRDVAELFEQTLLEADGHNYRMQAWVVMPNHIHLVVDVWDMPLVKLINGWKGKSSRLANVLLQSQREILAGGLLRHAGSRRGAFETRHPLHGTKSRESISGKSRARMAVEQRLSSR